MTLLIGFSASFDTLIEVGSIDRVGGNPLFRLAICFHENLNPIFRPVATQTPLTEDASKAIKAVLADVEFNVLRSMQKSRWLNFMGCLACGILGGLLVWASVAFTQYYQNQRYIELGKATATTWEKLDGKAKAAVNAELK